MFLLNLIQNFIHAGDLENFLEISKKVLDEHAPTKKKYVRANQAAFLNKDINKAIMSRSQLRNRYLRCRTDTNKSAYKKAA